MVPMGDLEETMRFDPDEGIANLDEHLDRLMSQAEGQGFKFDRHAARNELQAATFGKRRPEISGRGSSRTASCRRTMPPISASSTSLPPQRSSKPGSWLPTIHVQSSLLVNSVSSARASSGRRSQPKRSWKLSPRQ